MTLHRVLAALALCLGASLAAASPVDPVSYRGSGAEHRTVPASPGERRIMVMLKLGPDHMRAGNEYGGDYGDAVGQRLRLRAARKLARQHHLTLLESWPMTLIGVDCVVMTVNDDRTLDAVVKELSTAPGVAWSQPLNEFEMRGAAPSGYNDKLYRAQPSSSQWQLAKLHRFATGRGVTIAIIDSRVDVAHPDFAGQSVRIEDFVPGRRLSAERHGTAVAGIIAARANNAMGIVGVAPDARILALRACWENTAGGRTVCDSLSLAKALVFALESRADIINLSLTGPQDRLLATLIAKGLSQGGTVIAAVDNRNPGTSFPASVAGVIPVGDERLSLRAGAVYIAPGLDIPTAEPEGKWSLVNGSSYAAAHVSGLAALLRQLNGSRGRGRLIAGAFGPRGTIDACAVVARFSTLDARACQTRQ